MDPVTTLSLGRLAVGVAGLAQPALVAKAVGVDPVTNAQGSYVIRLFATREVALGALTLLARGAARRNLVLAGIAVDLGDAGVAVAAVRDRSLPARSAAVLLGPALGAVFSGASSLRTRRRLELSR